VVKADGSWSRDGVFEPRHHILDGCKHKHTKIKKIKVAKWGTTTTKKNNRHKTFWKLYQHSKCELQQAPLNVITLGQAIYDYINQMITLSSLNFPLKEAKFRNMELDKTTWTDNIIWLITLFVILISDSHCNKIYLFRLK
jgi:hypothetical protein